MAKNILGEMRRAQVIMSGPGCILDFRTPDGASVSVIAAGLDDWDFTAPLRSGGGSDPSRIYENRLQKLIIKKIKERPGRNEAFCNYFRVPPVELQDDIRRSQSNAGLQLLPAYRFPNFLLCRTCGRLKEASKWGKEPGQPARWSNCDCAKKSKKQYVIPPRFIISCIHGHLSDFPWKRWLNEYSRYQGNCSHDSLFLSSSGSSSLKGLVLRCVKCESKANLENIFERDAFDFMKCEGKRPWLGKDASEKCDQKPKALLRSSANTYFPVTESLISIPPWEDNFSEMVGDMDNLMKLDAAGLKGVLTIAAQENGLEYDDLKEDFALRKEYLADCGDDPLALEFKRFTIDPKWPETKTDSRHFKKHRMKIPDNLKPYLSDVIKVTRLREVKALINFKRINQPASSTNSGKGFFASLSKKPIDWFPAIEVFGEGIFFNLDSELVRKWEKQESIVNDAEILNKTWIKAWDEATAWSKNKDDKKNEAEPLLTPRFLLVHSLAHAFINQLAFDSGYNASSLKERIYVSEKNDQNDMAGILIYTSTSDSDGTLGGLSEKAEPEFFEPTFIEAIKNQEICSNDPICIQGITSLSETYNLAACHSCLLLPETSCIHFNRFLNRATLTGNSLYKGEFSLIDGFFKDLL